MNLAPEILKMRDALLERIKGKSLREVSEIVNEILLNETNNINRLAALSARVQVLRDFTKKEFNLNKGNNLINKSFHEEKNKEMSKQDLENNNTTPEKNEDSETWVRVEMLKSGIVNGVRFPEGVVIDVSKVDAEKLEEEGLTKIVENTTNEKTKEVKDKAKEQATEASPQEEVKDEAKEEATETSPQEEVKDEAKEQATEASPQEEVKDEAKEQATEASPQEEVKDKAKEEVAEASPQEEVKVAVNDELTNVKSLEKNPNEKLQSENKLEEKKILKKKSTKITEETIELTDPKAVAEALGLNESKKKEQEPVEIEEEVDLETLETGK